MKNIDSVGHVTGSSVYIDDVAVPDGCLHACVLYSRSAHGSITKYDSSAVEAMDGVHAVLSASDIPGANQIGGIIADEPLLAEGVVHFYGQPIALVVAETERIARQAVEHIVVEIAELPVITDPREAAAQGQLIMPPMQFKLGDSQSAFERCEWVVEGRADSGGQEHLYLEPQGSLAAPRENGGIHVISSTQGPTAVQRTVARVLGLSMHQVEVDVQRLGGGFGGKEDQATPWACLAALAAHTLQRPVKLVLSRHDDMRMTGKRHPYSSDFKLGLDKEGRFIAFEASYYQNAGAAADLSPPVLGRTLFHCTNSYAIPHVTATGYSCKTHLVPNTAFRGFGGPQGMFVIEAAIQKAAEVMGVPAHELQRRNLLSEGDEFPYGQKTEACQARRCFEELEARPECQELISRVETFNQEHHLEKKGYAFMPICFGISFTKTVMNQAGSLVHVYQDGSISISTGAVEMGQGVNTRMLQVASSSFSVDPKRVRIQSTNTARVANTSPTAASSAADLNGKATELACQEILGRLRVFAAAELGIDDVQVVEIREECVCVCGEKTELTWTKLVAAAYLNRIHLSASGHYATPDLHFDDKKSKGHPFAYHVYGSSLTEVTLDCLRGRYTVDAVHIVHDCGASMNPAVDLGQIEGGLVQGIGWMTIEEVLFSDAGVPMTDTLSAYKVPDIYSAPQHIDVRFLKDAANPMGVFNSKAVGEPPLMYGIGSFCALRNAMRAFAPSKEHALHAPLTPERVLMSLYQGEVDER